MSIIAHFAVRFLRGFCLGNAIKYIDRAGKKDGSSEETDLHKALEYITLYLEYKNFKVEPVRDRGAIADRLDKTYDGKTLGEILQRNGQ